MIDNFGGGYKPLEGQRWWVTAVSVPIGLVCLLVFGLVVSWMVSCASPAYAHAGTTAQFLDQEVIPKDSPITGTMVLAMKQWYGIPVLKTLTILTAETSLGSSKGGRLVKANNFGCMAWSKAGAKKPWGRLSDGRVRVAGRYWYSYPSAWAGMMSWGRLMKLGYLSRVNDSWESFAGKYHEAEGRSAYVARLYKIESHWRAVAHDHGYNW